MPDIVLEAWQTFGVDFWSGSKGMSVIVWTLGPYDCIICIGISQNYGKNTLFSNGSFKKMVPLNFSGKETHIKVLSKFE